MEDSKVATILEDINTKFNAIQESLLVLPIMQEDIKTLKEDMTVVKASLKNKADIEQVNAIAKELETLKQKIA